MCCAGFGVEEQLVEWVAAGEEHGPAGEELEAVEHDHTAAEAGHEVGWGGYEPAGHVVGWGGLDSVVVAEWLVGWGGLGPVGADPVVGWCCRGHAVAGHVVGWGGQEPGGAAHVLGHEDF